MSAGERGWGSSQQWRYFSGMFGSSRGVGHTQEGRDIGV